MGSLLPEAGRNNNAGRRQECNGRQNAVGRARGRRDMVGSEILTAPPWVCQVTEEAAGMSQVSLS